MDIGVIVLSLVVGLFGLASAVLGFIAERTKLTGHDIDIDVSGECNYPANPAYLLSLIAIPLLAVAMIIASLAAGSCGCCRPRHGASKSKRVTGIVCAVFSWIAALIAGVIYANGVAWNLPVTRYDSWCRLLRDGYLRMAALLSLAAISLAITSYSMLRAQAAPAAMWSTSPAPAAAGAASGPNPDDSYPPAAEAVAVPAETQWSAPQRHGQWQEPPTGGPLAPCGKIQSDTIPRDRFPSSASSTASSRSDDGVRRHHGVALTPYVFMECAP